MFFIYCDRKDDEFGYGSTFCVHRSTCKIRNCANCLKPDISFSTEQKKYIRRCVERAIDEAKRCTEYYNQTVFGCHYNNYLRSELESLLANLVGVSTYDLFYKDKQHV